MINEYNEYNLHISCTTKKRELKKLLAPKLAIEQSKNWAFNSILLEQYFKHSCLVKNIGFNGFNC